MSTADFYSDRHLGAIPRTSETLPAHTSAALISLVDQKISSHWFAEKFPERCEDGRSSVSGTDEGALSRSVRGLISGIDFPLWRNEDLRDETIFDLIEFAASRVALPVEGRWHDYRRHHELSFEPKKGRREFSVEVNQLLTRGGTLFELNDELRVERIGTEAVRAVLGDLRSSSGDAELDALVYEAGKRYRSRDESDRVVALEKLWDAFERLKTIDLPGQNVKKASAEALLEHVHRKADRAVLSAEMKALTDVGNQFTIRHHETDKHPVSAELREYLFARMGSLIIILLQESDRIG